MDTIERKMEQAQSLRKEINTIMLEQVQSLRECYHQLLTEVAEKLCPFSVGDIITLPNKKKGKIKEIRFYSVDPEFLEMLNLDTLLHSESYSDIPGYLYPYKVHGKEFSITWSVSGIRLRKDGKEGLVPFSELSPIYHDIDTTTKQISDKPTKNFLDTGNYMTFDDLGDDV